MAIEHSDHDADVGRIEPDQLYFIEMYLRQRGDHKRLLAVDALVLRDDLDAEEKARELQSIIQGALNGKR